MDLSLRGLVCSKCLVYVGDVIVMSKSFDEHLWNLGSVLQRMWDANLKLKVSKCHLCRRAVKFLGHIVSGAGTSVDEEKTRVMIDWPAPVNVAEVRYFVSTCSYYRRYVAGFATIAVVSADETWRTVRLECGATTGFRHFEVCSDVSADPRDAPR